MHSSYEVISMKIKKVCVRLNFNVVAYKTFEVEVNEDVTVENAIENIVYDTEYDDLDVKIHDVAISEFEIEEIEDVENKFAKKETV